MAMHNAVLCRTRTHDFEPNMLDKGKSGQAELSFKQEGL
jgi:hypothetical protein